MDVKQALEVLAATGKFSVLQKFEEVPEYFQNTDGEEVGLCLVVDTETTGLNHSKDKIFEFGGVMVEYGLDSGKVFKIVDNISMLEDPGVPIPPEVVKLTHVTDDDVRGHKFDDARINAAVERANFVVAHNAGFDRKMLEKRFPVFIEKPWGCSLKDVNWAEELDIGSGKLDYIAMKLGFYFDGAHRANNDCAATVHVLAQMVDGTSIMSRLLNKAREASYVVWAVGSPFETKDLLKENGYRWNGGEDGRPKSWYKEVVGGDAMSAELEFLDKSVYSGRKLPEVERVDALTRYSARPGTTIDLRQTPTQRFSPR